MPWIIPPETVLTYTAAATALVLLPGPAQALIVTRSVERGARAGIITAVGLDAATVLHTFASALGLSAILAASATAFTVVKLAGAAYLMWLGVRMLRAAPSAAPDAKCARGAPSERFDAGRAPTDRDRRLLIHGFVTGLLNPR